MVPEHIMQRVVADVGRHVRCSKGYEVESWINPLTPVNCVAAFAMAKDLIERDAFDICVSVAPEGHVYGYFFHCLGAAVLSVHVDYPPRRCEVLDDLDGIRGKRVLILEDDVASGTTLRHVIRALENYEPLSIDLYLGRPKEAQVVDFIDPAIRKVYLAEEHLDPDDQDLHDSQFILFFEHK